MDSFEIQHILDSLAASGNRRTLCEADVRGKHIVSGGRTLLNFSSNDYLGLTETGSAPGFGPAGEDLQREFFSGLDGRFVMGNPSSRLMSGNIPEYSVLEDAIARLYPAGRTALVLNTGYTVNTGALAALTAKGDLVVADHSSHASLMDGLKLCEADSLRFRHNDVNHLEEIVRKNRGKYTNIWVVTESVFSMDGDIAPLGQIVELKERHGLQIFLDEAHSFGLWSENGAGYASHLGLADRIDVIAAPMGKALASSGGFLIVDPLTRELLVNRMRTLIFATAIPAVNLLWSKFIIERLPSYEARREHLRHLTAMLAGPNATQIIPLITGDSKKAVEMAGRLREAGFWVTAIRHPTVPKGRERVRISLNASITEAEAEAFRAAWQTIDEAPGL